tara:strand:- start:663 stop:782 length:120 start_codon:yes stop_codon:yes gene_type:complete
MCAVYDINFINDGAIMKEEVVLIIAAMGFLLTLKLMGWL